ncbi:MAG: PQQ-dependent sugar dehydrogenase [Thermoanaerobaculia bacterium]
MQRTLVLLTFLFLPIQQLDAAGPLPGFRVETVAVSSEFITSLAVDSRGTLYYTTHTARMGDVPGRGDLYRLVGGAGELVATFPTEWEGNAGLLGVALLDDDHAVVHYTTPGRWQHIISRVDLRTGVESLPPLARMESLPPNTGGDISTEHHGGNLTVGADGAIWFGIGDFGGFVPAQDPKWIAGKIWRLTLDGTLTQWASGLRNPYDLAWDPVLQRIVVGDNGSQGNDEIHVIQQGDDCGWPNPATPEGKISVPPVYVFQPKEKSIAPTGLLRVNGRNPIVRRGYIVAGFVTRSLYYFPSLTTAPAADPVTILDRHEAPIIDVVDGPDGTIYFSTGAGTSKIFRLQTPKRGDCNGDGLASYDDLAALDHELHDGQTQPMVTVGGGAYAGSWGCDANGDGIVTAADGEAIQSLITKRRRAVRR